MEEWYLTLLITDNFRNKYDFISNNCGTAAASFLRTIGISMIGREELPTGLAEALYANPGELVSKVTEYPPTTPTGGTILSDACNWVGTYYPSLF